MRSSSRSVSVGMHSMGEREVTRRDVYETLIGIAGLILLLIAAWELGGAWAVAVVVGAFCVCWSFS